MIILRRVAIKAQNKVESLTASQGEDECVWLLLLPEDAAQRFLRPEWAQKWPSLLQSLTPSKPEPSSLHWWPSGVCTQPQVRLSRTIMDAECDRIHWVLWVCIGAGMSGWGGCMDGQDVFAMIRENSHYGEIVAELVVESTEGNVWWSVGGKDADWFFLENSSIRLNTSAERVLDREVSRTFIL